MLHTMIDIYVISIFVTYFMFYLVTAHVEMLNLIALGRNARKKNATITSSRYVQQEKPFPFETSTETSIKSFLFSSFFFFFF